MELNEREQAKESLLRGYCAFYALGDERQCKRLRVYLKETWLDSINNTL